METIGDGYLCVSGLPHRNGNQHAKDIAEMSMSLLRAIKGFRIPHLPKERINIRVGLHTGILELFNRNKLIVRSCRNWRRWYYHAKVLSVWRFC